jgi:hypothetical protein
VVKAQVFGSKGPYPDEDAIDMLCPGSLYPRVFTEGVFGIVPTGFNSFECTPRPPKDWPRMALRDLRAFGRAWDLVVERAGNQQSITVTSGGQRRANSLYNGRGTAEQWIKEGKNAMKWTKLSCRMFSDETNGRALWST